VDSMTGQDAAVTAKHFGEALPLTGVVLTKTDGDARGGAALSVRYITGKPIKFVGVGEKPDGLDVFHPDRAAGRILDMGDVLSLVEQVESQVDQDKAKKLAEKVAKGKKFDLNDMRDQLEQMQNMGGLAGLMDKLPGVGQLPEHVKQQVTGKEVPRMIAIINSMTKKERRNPGLLNGSRRARIARGSGLTPADVNKVLKQYQQMEKMMGKLGRGGMKGMMRGLSGMMGGRGGMMPPMRVRARDRVRLGRARGCRYTCRLTRPFRPLGNTEKAPWSRSALPAAAPRSAPSTTSSSPTAAAP